MNICEKIKWAAKNSLDVYGDVKRTFLSAANCFDWTEVDSAQKPIRGISIYKCTGKLGGIRYAYESWVGDSEGERCRKQLEFDEELSVDNIFKALMTISDNV